MSNDFLSPNNWSETLSKWISSTFTSDAASDVEVGGSLDLQALEDRVLYSAGPLPVDMAGQVEVSETPDLVDLEDSVDNQFEIIENGIEEYQFSEFDQITLSGNLAPQSHELVIVDRSVEGYESLVEDLLSSKSNDRAIEIVYLDSNQDGIKQVSNILSTRSNLNAIHLVSHGSDGNIQLGNTELNSATLASESVEIEAWQNALAIDADLLIYGCNVAESEFGEAFVDELSELIDADISASADITGHGDFQGDWHFEYQVGVIESDIVFSSVVQADWMGALVAVDMSGEDLIGDSTANRAIAADFNGQVTQVFASDEFPDSDGLDIYVVQFDADGNELAPPTKVNVSNDVGDQSNATIAMNDNGDFVVVWTSDDGTESTVNAKIFNTDGTIHELTVGDQSVDLSGTGVGPMAFPGPVGTTETSTVTSASNASVSLNQNGEFIIVWEGSGSADIDGIYGQRFGLDGVAVDSMAFLVNSTINTGYQGSPDVAINNAGDFVVSWDDTVSSTEMSSVYYTVYDANLDQLQVDFEHLTRGGTYFTGTAVDIDENRNVALVTQGDSTFDFPFLHANINVFSIQYDSAAGTWSDEFTFAHDSIAISDQYRPSVVIADNEIVVAWDGEATDGSDNSAVFLSVFDLDLNLLQSETNLIGGADGTKQSNVSLTTFHDGREWALGYVDASTGYENLIGNVNPIGSSNVIVINEGESHTLSSGEFGYDNSVGGAYSDNDPFASITVESVSTTGQLLYNGTAIAPGTEISVEEINSGSLVYTAGLTAGVDAAFTFTVSDGLDNSENSYQIDFDVHSEQSGNALALGDELVSLDGAQLVNTTIEGNQTGHSLDALSNGNYVVSWYSFDGADFEILQSVYDADGNAIVSNQVIELGSGRPDPSVVALEDGYVLVWTQDNQVFGQRFDSSGNLLGVDGTPGGIKFHIDQVSADAQFSAVGAGLSDGGFVIAWTTEGPNTDADAGVAARVFNVNGQASDQFLVNQATAGSQFDVSVASTKDNGFVIGWNDLSSNSGDVKARVFDGGDISSGTEITLHNSVSGLQSDLALETLTDGRVVAVWESDAQDGDGVGAFGVVINPDGTLANVNGTTAEFQINPSANGDQRSPDVIATGDGGFLAIWESSHTEIDSTEIIGLRFDSQFNAIGDEFIVNSHRGGSQTEPQATVLENGQVVVVWSEADGGQANSTFENGVYIDRFDFGVSGLEDQPISIHLNNLIEDSGSETLTKVVVENLPFGAYLTDGNEQTVIGNNFIPFDWNSGSGTFQLNGVDWDLGNLQIVPAPDSHEDFELRFTSHVSEPGTTVAIQEQFLKVEVNAVDDAMVNTQPLSISIAENAVGFFPLSNLLGLINDPDFDPAISHHADSAFLASTTSGSPVAGQFVWSSSDSANNVTLDATGVAFVEDSQSAISAFDSLYEFNGTSGGVIDQATLDSFSDGGGFEIWLKPTDLVGDRVILDWSSSDQGLVLYQRGDQVVLELYDEVNFPGSEPTILVADGLSDSEFNQISFQLFAGAGGPLGQTNGAEIQLNLNGQLADQVIDAPTVDDQLDWANLGAANLGMFDGTSFADTATVTNFEGQIAQIEIFKTFESGDEVERRYLNTLNVGEIVEVAGQSIATNSIFPLPSGAIVTIDANGDLTYDPNGAFDGLQMGETDNDIVTYRVNNGAGESVEFVANVEILGLGINNVAPVINILTPGQTNEDVQLDSNLNSFVSDPNGDTLVYSIVNNSVNGTVNLNPDGSFSYDPNPDFFGTDSFDFEVDDQNGQVVQGTYLVNVDPVNDMLMITRNIGAGFTENSVGNVITQAMLETTDVDDSSAELTYTLTSQGTEGVVKLNGAMLATGGTFTQAQINSGLLTYDHNGGATNDSFGFEVADGGEDGTTQISSTFDIEIAILPNPPIAFDNTYGVNFGGTRVVTIDEGLLYNDFDPDTLGQVTLETQPLHGTVVISPDGTFEYIHDGLSKLDDSFQYRVVDSTGEFAVATVHIHVDETGFVPGNEFLVNDPSTELQNLENARGFYSESAVATRANGDYVVTWTDHSGGTEEVKLQRFDFSGTPIGDVIDVSSQLAEGLNHHSSVAIAADGSFVVVWANEFDTSSHDGSESSIYFQRFDAAGNEVGGAQQANSAAFAAGKQVNPDIAINDSGEFAITWHGAAPNGNIREAIFAVFDSNGVTSFGPEVLNGDLAGFDGTIEDQTSIAIGNDGAVAISWNDGDSIHLRFLNAAGILGDEISLPVVGGADSIQNSSLDISDSGLLALAFEIEFPGGETETRLQVFDIDNPVLVVNNSGSQTQAGSQTNPSVSFGDDDTIILTWHGNGDGDTNGVFARKFRVESDSNNNPIAIAIGDEILVNQTTAGSQVGASVSAIDSENFVVVWSGNGVGDLDGVFARQFGNQDDVSLSGRVVDDVNADSNITNDGANSGVSGAAVYVYRDDGDNVISAGDILVRQTTTRANGDYVFDDLNGSETYWVVVDSKTVLTSAANVGLTIQDAWADQTYGDGGAKYGGLSAGTSDDASSLLTSQHVSRVELGQSDYEDLDFGFSFNVVTNLAGGDAQDDDTGNNLRSVQGSLRQFIVNANTIVGGNELRFVPGAAVQETNGTDSWWKIQISESLPSITDSFTVIDGTAYSSLDGTTVLNPNSTNHSTLLGADGVAGTGDETVGVGPDGRLSSSTTAAADQDERVLALATGPSLEIQDINGVRNGLGIFTADVEIANIAINGFGDPNEVQSGNIFVGVTGARAYIHDNVIGAEAGNVDAPLTSDSTSNGIYVFRADSGIIENNFIAFNGATGVRIQGSTGNFVEDWNIVGNEILGNAFASFGGDGIDLFRATNINIEGNFISGNAGFAVDNFDSVGNLNIVENTITSNGLGGFETGGVRLFGTGNSVEHNIISGNIGGGVVVTAGHTTSGFTFTASTENLISQNSFFDNSGNAIDLVSSSNADTNRFGDGVSDNDSAPDVGGNDGLDHPELFEAFVDAAGLHVFGTVDQLQSFDRVEVYLAQSDAGDLFNGQFFGEGQTYLGDVGGADVVAYDTTTGEFQFVLAAPSSGWPTELFDADATITVIGIQASGNTTEFSNVTEVRNSPPVAENDFVSINEDGAFSVLPNVLDNDSDPDVPNSSLTVTRLTDTANGTLVLNPDGSFDYTPDQDFFGTDTFEYRVTDLAGNSSDAMVTITVVSVNDDPTIDSIIPAPVMVFENDVNVIQVVASDVEMDTLTFSLPVDATTDNDLFSISPSGQIVFNSAPDLENPGGLSGDGTYTVSVLVEDGNGGTATTTLDILLLNVDETPVAVDDVFGSVLMEEGGTSILDVTSNDTDEDGDFVSGPSSVVIISGPVNGVATVNTDGDIVYTHDGSENHFDTIVYEIIDETGLRDSATISIEVQPVNDSPTVVDDDLGSVAAGQELVVDSSVLLANDSDVDNDLSVDEIVIVTQPEGGSVVILGDELIFTPDAGLANVETFFEYQIVTADGVASELAVARLAVSAGVTQVVPIVEEVVTESENEEAVEESQPELTGPPISNGVEDDDEINTKAAGSARINDNLGFAGDFSGNSLENSSDNNEFKVDYTGATYAYANRVDDLSVVNLSKIIVNNSGEELSEFQTVLLAGLDWNDDGSDSDFIVNPLEFGVSQIAASAAGFITVGYLAWFVRGGVLLTTFMSSIPAWSAFDILSVLDAADGGESIEQMVDQ